MDTGTHYSALFVIFAANNKYMEIAGYLASLLIGISLGLIGGGGSILTIPVLVYLFHLSPSIATGYSLFIVGCSSLAGAWKNYHKGNINFKAAFYFGISSIYSCINQETAYSCSAGTIVHDRQIRDNQITLNHAALCHSDDRGFLAHDPKTGDGKKGPE